MRTASGWAWARRRVPRTAALPARPVARNRRRERSFVYLLGTECGYNRTSNLFGNMTANITPRVGTSLDSYILGDVLTGTLPDGTPYSVQTYKLNLTTLPSGNVTRNVPGYYTDYHGLEVN